jgi:hypothetical protein
LTVAGTLEGAHASAGAAAQAASGAAVQAASGGQGDSAPAGAEIKLVWDDETLSVEERRASLPRYSRRGSQVPVGGGALGHGGAAAGAGGQAPPPYYQQQQQQHHAGVTVLPLV